MQLFPVCRTKKPDSLWIPRTWSNCFLCFRFRHSYGTGETTVKVVNSEGQAARSSFAIIKPHFMTDTFSFQESPPWNRRHSFLLPVPADVADIRSRRSTGTRLLRRGGRRTGRSRHRCWPADIRRLRCTRREPMPLLLLAGRSQRRCWPGGPAIAAPGGGELMHTSLELGINAHQRRTWTPRRAGPAENRIE